MVRCSSCFTITHDEIAEVTRALDGIAQQHQEEEEGAGGAEKAQEALTKLATKVRPFFFLRVLFDLDWM